MTPDELKHLEARAALAERAVELLERIAMESRLPMARKVTEFLADARRVLKEGT